MTAGRRTEGFAGTIDAAALAVEVAGLRTRVDRLVAGATRYPPNRRLLGHLARERDALFTFLETGGVRHPLACRAGHPPRRGVPQGLGRPPYLGRAGTWQVLASVLRTAHQQDRDPVELLIGLLRAARPMIADLAIPKLS